MQGAWGSIPGWGTKIPHADVLGPKNKLKKKKEKEKENIKKTKNNSPNQFLVYFSRCVSCIYKYINSCVLFLKNKWNHAIHNSSYFISLYISVSSISYMPHSILLYSWYVIYLAPYWWTYLFPTHFLLEELLQ